MTSRLAIMQAVAADDYRGAMRLLRQLMGQHEHDDPMVSGLLQVAYAAKTAGGAMLSVEIDHVAHHALQREVMENAHDLYIRHNPPMTETMVAVLFGDVQVHVRLPRREHSVHVERLLREAVEGERARLVDWLATTGLVTDREALRLMLDGELPRSWLPKRRPQPATSAQVQGMVQAIKDGTHCLRRCSDPDCKSSWMTEVGAGAVGCPTCGAQLVPEGEAG